MSNNTRRQQNGTSSAKALREIARLRANPITVVVAREARLQQIEALRAERTANQHSSSKAGTSIGRSIYFRHLIGIDCDDLALAQLLPTVGAILRSMGKSDQPPRITKNTMPIGFCYNKKPIPDEVFLFDQLGSNTGKSPSLRTLHVGYFGASKRQIRGGIKMSVDVHFDYLSISALHEDMNLEGLPNWAGNIKSHNVVSDLTHGLEDQEFGYQNRTLGKLAVAGVDLTFGPILKYTSELHAL
jgi:hypothetical protein